ncbi:alpha/beta family hydrolase [Pseudooceanicola sp. LIPI14-2-Ac024]|uniref:alpha/beta family hydrolase n=1 Tax=Pseudooceanicola sp. LIPI14-2-Ac024 TaxID=3344875 RepID=UPI0035D066EB
MDAVEFLIDGDGPGRVTILLAHGSGSTMDTPWMDTVAAGLAGRGLRVARFEFAYMAARRHGGPKRPPPRVETLVPEYMAAIEALACDGPLVIGGKSMGGRIACMTAQELFDAGRVAGLVCLGFPFHPPKRPETLRGTELATITCPTLICQGTRDPFGTQDEVAAYPLSPQVRLEWLEDGDHDLSPRKRMTGRTLDDHLAGACAVVAGWAQSLPGR